MRGNHPVDLIELQPELLGGVDRDRDLVQRLLDHSLIFGPGHDDQLFCVGRQGGLAPGTSVVNVVRAVGLSGLLSG